MTATTRSERAFMLKTTNRIHANYDKSSGEANAKVRLERAVRTDVMYVCTIAKETRQHRASPRTQAEDVLGHTLLHLQALVLPRMNLRDYSGARETGSTLMRASIAVIK
jgi:hypothetical protein